LILKLVRFDSSNQISGTQINSILNTYADYKTPNKSRAVANHLVVSDNDVDSQYSAWRPAAIVQRKQNTELGDFGSIRPQTATVQMMNANPNPPVAVPQQQQQQPVALNVNAPAFVPQQPQPQQPALNVNAPAFVPQQAQQPQVAPYPIIANNTPVQAALLGQIGNLPQANVNYQIVGEWHEGFEPWAHGHGFNNGMVAHFNVRAGQGPMLHVYHNAAGGLEVVPIGQRPTGY
jgi:hypothetical protein